MGVPVFNLAPDLTVSRLCLGFLNHPSCFSLYGTENGLNLSFKNPFSLFLFFCFSGTMTFGEQNSLSQSFGLLSLAFHSGINFFDSAEIYPVPQRAETQGKSEEYIGRWIRETKIPVIALSWRQSLKRLRTNYIDLYQIHWPDRYVPMFGETEYDPTRQFSSVFIEEQLDALGRAVDAGKIAEHIPGHPKIISVQNSYNLLCRNFDSGMAECCDHERISLLGLQPSSNGNTFWEVLLT
ncbi:uncharacterized protein LOC100244190 isoform X4 [Vitis vinifera]|uniref:uncharacterized protein LOC100244190 isoform X4 n=1 Tax=Vitis vinifera TaxID=29760 RepID=UPI0008FFCAEF|nr:uncharacterized protein LOC100244190 isoform X4 [Vitis vinifera]|eukprot:XP_019076694.1 PREDICTED: uncharacterized protein LOC100244190 isoform X4 [Vitis vinifera]